MDLAGVRSLCFVKVVVRVQIDLRSRCRLCSSCWNFQIERSAPSLLATRAETRLTVYRAPQVFSQKWRYLAALWSDFAEKLPIWSFLHADSDFEDERSGKIL